MAPTAERERERETEKIQWDQDRFGSMRRVAPEERNRKTFKLGSYRYGSCPRKKINGAGGQEVKGVGPGSCGCPGNLVKKSGVNESKGDGTQGLDKMAVVLGMDEMKKGVVMVDLRTWVPPKRRLSRSEDDIRGDLERC